MYSATSQAASRATREAGWSLAEVQLTCGTVVSMNINANPSISQHLIQFMKSYGFLELRNPQESMSIDASRVVAIKLTKITSQEQ